MLNGDPLAIVGYNSPRQRSSPVRPQPSATWRGLPPRRGWQTSQLPVSHAFHTPLVAAAVPVLAEQLARENFCRPKRKVFSTVTGARLEGDEDLRELLCRQVTSPVRFESALAALLGAGADRMLADTGKRAPPAEWIC